MKGSFRHTVKEQIVRHEFLFLRLLHFAILLFSILIMNWSFGYQEAVSKPYFALLIAAVGAFLPTGGIAVVLVVYLLLQMYAISWSVLVTTAVMLLIFFILSQVFGANRQLHYVFMPSLYRINLIYLAPVEAGLMGSRSEVVPIIAGSVMAFYLREIRLHAPQFMEPDGGLSILSLLKENLFGNQMFYIFVLAMVVLFLLISILKSRPVRHAWFVAVVIGLVVEFVIMLTGYLFTDNYEQIMSLVIGNVIALGFSFVFNFVFYDMNHSRMEKLQFEDDDYYYYVTAVPKIHFVSEEKDVKIISGDGKKRAQEKAETDTDPLGETRNLPKIEP